MMKEHLGAWSKTLYVVAYFVLLAVFVPRAQADHMGTQGMFFVMVASAVALAILYLLIRLVVGSIQRSREGNPLSREERKSYLSGSTHALLSAGNTEFAGSSSLVTVDSRSLMRLPQTSQLLPAVINAQTLALVDDDYGYEEDGDEDEELEDD